MYKNPFLDLAKQQSNEKLFIKELNPYSNFPNIQQQYFLQKTLPTGIVDLESS